MSRAFKCDICGELFEDRMYIAIDKNKHAYLEFCGTKYDICPNCTTVIQSTIDLLKPSNCGDIGCDTCKYSPVNTIDYMRCHKCTGFNLWEAKE